MKINELFIVPHPYVDVWSAFCDVHQKKTEGARSCTQDCLFFSTADSTACIGRDVNEPCDEKIENRLYSTIKKNW
jgi:hypothetical protein